MFVRANKIKISTCNLVESLKHEGFDLDYVANENEIIKVLNPSNRIKLSPLYLNGYFEFQDFASQIAVRKLPIHEGMSVLDFCAGGGGKSLALASSFKNKLRLYAYDTKESRLKAFKYRANRASARIVFLNKKMCSIKRMK